ncbi:MAG: hypothetical protein ACI9RU_000113 [Litorivivens sp.]|jgi:hypothetical protein
MKVTWLSFLLGLLSIMTFSMPTEAFAQKKSRKNKGKSTEKKEDSYTKTINGCLKHDGLFTLFQDTVTGKTFLEISDNQLETEFIYFSHVEDGVVDAGFFRGAYRSSKIISFHKVFDHIEVIEHNTDFYFDETNALSKASNANINNPVLSSQKIESQNKDGNLYLISGNSLFLSEQFQMVKPPSNPKNPSLLGNLSKEKSKVRSINNYPENSEIRVEYVYENKNPKRGGSAAVTDVRNISVVYQHSLLAIPESNYTPRRDDSRLGFFMTQVNDMTSFSPTPYKDIIHRWNLEKKDSSASISDPIKPITYWIENTTPEEFRPIIKEGIERWNIAFEKAGFSNAVVVNIQPDDADWDAGDIRYNVVRWTSSPRPPFGGYGPSFVNPRTGEILGADIMLEFVSITNRLFKTDVFELAGTQTDLDFENDISSDPHFCGAGKHLHHNMIFGLQAMRSMNMDKAAKEEFVKQTLYRLVLHEVGHTLGLSHNMRGSTMLSPDEIKNKELVDEIGLCNSVMEYPSINYAKNKEEQTLYYDVKPGLYDHWIIEYGYSPSELDPIQEETRLNQILSKSTDPRLAFGNDADDMRSSGKGINPDVNIYDLSNDPLSYAIERCDLVNEILPKIKDSFTIDGQSYHELRNAYYILTGEYGTQIRIMTRQIAGIKFDRSYSDQGSEALPLEPVSEIEQKKAMDALTKYAFAPNAFDAPQGLYNYLYGQRRGFNHFTNSEDPKLHDRVLRLQGECLNHLLHQNVLRRLNDSQLYGNTYTLDAYLTDLTDAIFKEDLYQAVNSQRQNLQINYTERLVQIVDTKSKYDRLSKSMAWYELSRLEKLFKTNTGKNVMTKAHRQHIILLIQKAKEA